MNSGLGGLPSSLFFSTFFFKGTTVFGQCDDWTSFLRNSINLPYPNDDVAFSSLTVLFYADLTFRPSSSSSSRQRPPPPIATNFTTTCTDRQVLVDLTRTLTSQDATLTYEGNCDGNTWRVFSCSGSRVFCINCKKKCVSTVFCPGTSLVFNPCATCPTHSAAYAAASFQFTRIPKHPAIRLPLNLTVNSTWIAVQTSLSNVGNLYCAALPIGLGLQSVAQIRLLGAATAVQHPPPLSATVNLTGLYADTTYRVVCYTDDFSPQHAMPYRDALSTGNALFAALLSLAYCFLVSSYSVYIYVCVRVCMPPLGRTATTLCCRGVSLLVAHPVVAQFVPGSNIPEQQFFFALTAPPAAPLAVTIAVGSIPCGGRGSGGPLQTKPRSGDLAYAAPSAFQFSSPSPSQQQQQQLERSFFLRSGATGCFNITISGRLVGWLVDR